jgi:hypothetical protein
MSVIKVTPHTVREGQAESVRNNLLYEIIGRRYSQDFTVWTNSAKDGSNVVLKSRAVPQVGDAYQLYNDDDSVATCIRVIAKATANRHIWRVTAEYDTDRLVAMVTDNPLNQPPQVSWDYEGYEKPLVRDAFGISVKSSSGNAPASPYMQEYKRSILRVVRNEAAFDNSVAKQWQNKLNKLRFGGYDPLCARINHLNGNDHVVNGVYHWQVSYEIEFREESFRVFLLDQDFRDINGLIFRDKRDAAPMQNETPLNGRGKSLFDATSKLQAGIDNAVTTLQIATADVTKFPLGPRAANADGIVVGPDWYFYIRIQDEILQVVGGFNTDTFTVTRGEAGTTPAAHAANAKVELEPYFRMYIPTLYVDFTNLNLPIV